MRQCGQGTCPGQLAAMKSWSLAATLPAKPSEHPMRAVHRRARPGQLRELAADCAGEPGPGTAAALRTDPSQTRPAESGNRRQFTRLLVVGDHAEPADVPGVLREVRLQKHLRKPERVLL